MFWVVYGLLNRQHELILESRQSKLLMGLPGRQLELPSVSRWPAGHWVPPRLTRLTLRDSPNTSFCPDRSRKCFKFWIAGVFCCVCVVPAWSLWSGSRQRRVSPWASGSGRLRPNEMQMSRFTRYGQNKKDVHISGLDSVSILKAWGKKKTLDASQKVYKSNWKWVCLTFYFLLASVFF